MIALILNKQFLVALSDKFRRVIFKEVNVWQSNAKSIEEIGCHDGSSSSSPGDR